MAKYYGAPMQPHYVVSDGNAAAAAAYFQQEVMMAHAQQQAMHAGPQLMPAVVPMGVQLAQHYGGSMSAAQQAAMQPQPHQQQGGRYESVPDDRRRHGSSGTGPSIGMTAGRSNSGSNGKDSDDDFDGMDGLDDDGQVERLDEKTEAAMRAQLDRFLKDLHRCNSETEGLGACERKKIRNRKASRVSRLKKKLNVYDLQRNYNAAKISLSSQQRMIQELRDSLRSAATALYEHAPDYKCSKFDLRALVDQQKLIPNGMDTEIVLNEPVDTFKKLPLKMTPRPDPTYPPPTCGSPASVQPPRTVKKEDDDMIISKSDPDVEIEKKPANGPTDSGAAEALLALVGRK